MHYNLHLYKIIKKSTNIQLFDLYAITITSTGKGKQGFQALCAISENNRNDLVKQSLDGL